MSEEGNDKHGSEQKESDVVNVNFAVSSEDLRREEHFASSSLLIDPARVSQSLTQPA